MEKEEKASQKKTEKPASLTITRRSTNKEGGGGRNCNRFSDRKKIRVQQQDLV